jgi:hypothetical protein
VNEIWICGDCRSVNSQKQRRCYKCQVPRRTGEMTEATAAVSTFVGVQDVTVLEKVTRIGARYRPTWPVAIPLVPMIIAGTVLAILVVQGWSASINPSGQLEGDAETEGHLLVLSQAMAAAFGAGVLLWGLWIALVVRNVPALTARWAPNSPAGAFFAPFIPWRGWRRPHSVVRGVLAILSDGRSGPLLVALAWWVACLAAYIVPSVVWLARRSDMGQWPAFGLALKVWAALLVVAAILAIAVVVVVEREQRGAMLRRGTTLMAPQR